ncbi:MAG: arginase family protein [Nanoarchaeota archaeon]|nr:arginase family protein [Nanoarchaeota archaeon]
MNVIKIPFSAGGLGKTKGVEEGPDAIIAATKDFFSTEDDCVPSFEVSSVSVDQSNLESTNERIVAKAESVMKETDGAVFLGGDHSITYSLVKAFASVHTTNPGIVIFDAHADACTDFSPPTHEDLLLALVKENIISSATIILVGIRNLHPDELEFLQRHKITYYTMKDIANEGKEEIIDAVMAKAKDFGSLYVSFDIDVLDPAFAPGTGYLEPGGLSTRELLFFVHKLRNLSNWKASDIVEVNPSKDVRDLTATAAAKLLVELSSNTIKNEVQ